MTDDLPDLVIGSGPSGVSVAIARLNKGRNVLMIDAGRILEVEQAAQAENLAKDEPKNWSEVDVKTYKSGQFEAPGGAIRKFGSDYAINSPSEIFSRNNNGIDLRSSHAQGGLSNLWGASVLPSARTDISNWPAATQDLEKHYEAVTRFMPVSGRDDVLSEVYPELKMNNFNPLELTSQGGEFLRRADMRQDNLEIKIGAARNAVNGKCKACGLCLHGCPWGYIWSAAHTLETLQKQDGFQYQTGLVQSISNHKDRVKVRLNDGQTIEGKRLFLGAGVLETAGIIMRSFPALGALALLDSQHIFTPFLHSWRPLKNPESVQHHTLASAFIAFKVGDQKRISHSQLYTWNEQYLREMMANYGRKIPFSKGLFESLSKRLIVAQSFLHSDYSGQIALSLSEDGRLDAKAIDNPQASEIIDETRQVLGRNLRKIGLYALNFAGRTGAPGSSFHVGGSLPMSDTPSGAQSDVLGRLVGHERIHIVDASVMPSIPASTITFTVMANAHRIGMETPL